MATTGSGTSSAAAILPGSFTLAQWISRWRARLDDTLEPYLWSNDELTEYVDTLQKQLVAEMPILEDREDATICNISLVQGDGSIDLSMQRILRIEKAWIDGEVSPLTIVSSAYMDAYYGDWQGVDTTVAQNTPTVLVTQGMGTGKAWLYPPLASATGTLKMLVYRLPLLDLGYGDHSSEYLEIDKYAHLLIHGILQQAYLKQGADTYDPKRSDRHGILWRADEEKIRRMVLRERPTSYQTELPEGLF